MKVIFYYSETDEMAEGFVESVVSDINAPKIICTTLRELQSRFEIPVGECLVAVLLLRNQEELTQILAMRPDNDFMRSIIILPDRTNETIAQGHRLFPRFIAYRDTQFREIAIVLENMINHAVLQEEVLKVKSDCQLHLHDREEE